MNVLISLTYVFISTLLFIMAVIGYVNSGEKLEYLTDPRLVLFTFIFLFYYINRRILIKINSIEKIKWHRDLLAVSVIYVFVYMFIFSHVLFIFLSVSFHLLGADDMFEGVDKYYFMRGIDSYIGSYLGEYGVFVLIFFLYGILIYGKVFFSSRKEMINGYILISSSIFFYTLLIMSIFCLCFLLVALGAAAHM